MAGAEFAAGVGGSLVAAVLLRAGDVTRDRLGELFRTDEDWTELDEVETEFVDALEESITDLGSEC